MTEDNKTNDFKKELTSLLNRYGWDGACETPDHILADYIERCLNNYCSTLGINIAWHNWKTLEDNVTIRNEERWYYPSKGEYPKKNEWVLVIAKEDAYVLPGKWVMQYFDKSENILRSDKYFANTTNSIYASKVKCWKYIVPPKEKR